MYFEYLWKKEKERKYEKDLVKGKSVKATVSHSE